MKDLVRIGLTYLNKRSGQLLGHYLGFAIVGGGYVALDPFSSPPTAPVAVVAYETRIRELEIRLLLADEHKDECDKRYADLLLQCKAEPTKGTLLDRYRAGPSQ